MKSSTSPFVVAVRLAVLALGLLSLVAGASAADDDGVLQVQAITSRLHPLTLVRTIDVLRDGRKAARRRGDSPARRSMMAQPATEAGGVAGASGDDEADDGPDAAGTTANKPHFLGGMTSQWCPTLR